MVVAAVDVLFAADGRFGKKLRKNAGHVAAGLRQFAQLPGGNGLQIFGLAGGRIVKRSVIRDLAGRDLGHHFAVVFDAHQTVVGHMSDLDGVQVPFLEDLVHGLFPALFHDDEHALLAFGKQDLIRRHVRFALRDERHVYFDAAAASAGGLAG